MVRGYLLRTDRTIHPRVNTRGVQVRGKNPNMDELRQTVHGADGVAIVFGPRPPYTDIFCTDLTKNIGSAMEAEGVKRLICQTGAMIGDYSCNRSMMFKILCGRFHKSNSKGYEDRADQENVVKNSSLDWTIIKPPRLTESKGNKIVQAGENVKVGLLSSVSRKSLAQFIIKEFLTPRFIRKIIFIKN